MRLAVPELSCRKARTCPRAALCARKTSYRLVHANLRYVKLAQIGLATGLVAVFLPGLAAAEVVAPEAGPAALAVASDGTPRVAFLSVRDVAIATKSGTTWSFRRIGRVPGRKAFIAGLVVGPDGRTSV